jgi:hypothetical protein
MNDTEEAARRLFAAATEDVPPGIDLLRGVRARSRKRVVRVRSLVAVGAAGIVAAVASVTLSAVQAPSAFAQVMRAAARTGAASYQVRSEEKKCRPAGCGRSRGPRGAGPPGWVRRGQPTAPVPCAARTGPRSGSAACP